MKLWIAPYLVLSAITLSAFAKDNAVSLFGKWKVIDTGFECVTTGWLADTYEKKHGRIIGTAVDISAQRLRWGKLDCAPVKYQATEEEFNFFEGSACRETPGVLPKGCDVLMKALKGKSLQKITVSCAKKDPGLPVEYRVLSNKYAFANVDGNFI